MAFDFDTVSMRLAGFGYEMTDADKPLIAFCMERAAQDIKNFCHIDEVPEALAATAVDRTCGDFLYTKMASGSLSDRAFARVVKSVTEGDVKVDFAGEISDQACFEAFVNGLRTGGADALRHFRRLVWR